MKLIVNYVEAIAIIRRNLATTHAADAEIVIGRKPKRAEKVQSSPFPAFWNGITDEPYRRSIIFLRSELGGHGNTVNKINCIKELRCVAGYGLKEAKDAVENWVPFLAACVSLNRWPEVWQDGITRDIKFS